MQAGLLTHSASSSAAILVNTILLSGRMSDSFISIILKCELNTSISAAWLIIFETCLKDDSGIDLHDTDIDFLKFNQIIAQYILQSHLTIYFF